MRADGGCGGLSAKRTVRYVESDLVRPVQQSATHVANMYEPLDADNCFDVRPPIRTVQVLGRREDRNRAVLVAAACLVVAAMGAS